MFELVKELTMRHSIKSLDKVQDDDVSTLLLVQGITEIVEGHKQLGVTCAPLPKAMLHVC